MASGTHRPILVLLCSGAGAGRAARDFSRVEPVLRSRLPGLEVEELVFSELDAQLDGAWQRGIRDVVAGGGDGTLNALVQAVMRLDPERRRQLRVGALGLGSSNDFLKPPLAEAWVERVQVALSERRSRSFELGRVEVEEGVRYFLMNSSVGLIARACSHFAEPPWWLRGLRAGFGYGAAVQVHTVWNALAFPGVRARIRGGGREEEGLYSGITLLRTPHVAADVVFQTQRRSGDGLFDVVALSRVPAQELPEILAGFAREGPSEGGPVAFFQAREVDLEFPVPTLVEMDGEVTKTRMARYSLVPSAVTLLGPGI